MKRSTSTLLLLWALLVPASTALAAKKKFKVEPLDEKAPAEVSDSIRATLAEAGTRVVDSKGKAFLDLWLRKAVTTVQPREELGINLSMLGEGHLVGVVRVHKKADDFKGQQYRPGIFTCRYAVRPADGDHQGVSETRDFLLLSPVGVDTSPDPKTVEDLHEISEKVAKGGHPTVLYLSNHGGDGKKLPDISVNEDDDLWLLGFQIPNAEAKEKPIELWVVFEGISPDA